MQLGDYKRGILLVITSLIISTVILVVLKNIGFEINSDILLLFLLIFAMILVISGMVGELGIGSFYLKLRELSESEIEIPLEKIDYTPIEKGTEEYLYKILFKDINQSSKKPIYLSIKKGQNIGQAVLVNYLRTNLFDYVIFLNDVDKLDAYISASKLYGMLMTPFHNTKIQDKINEWKLKEIPFASSETINIPAKIGYALDTLENKNINEIALIDRNGTFQGILTRQQLNNKIIKQLLESKK